MKIVPQAKDSPPRAPELDVLTYLKPRIQLSPAEKGKLSNLQKGIEGEQKLKALLVKHLSPNYLILNDLLLTQTHTEFQIDIMLIGYDTVYPIEVKNYEGDYVVQNDKWYVASSQTEIRNPVHQLERSEVMLRSYLRQTSFQFAIEPYIIFVHPHFFLYQAPINLPVVFPNQIPHFIGKLKSASFRQTGEQKKLAKYLNDRQLSHSSYSRLPEYKYEELRKGIVCEACSSFLQAHNNFAFICKKCNHKEDITSGVKRSIREFATLFPGRKITTSAIHEWCQIISKRNTIQKILRSNYVSVGKGRSTHYTLK